VRILPLPKVTEAKPFKTGSGGRHPVPPTAASFAEPGTYASTERHGGSSAGSSAVDIHEQSQPISGRRASVSAYDRPLPDASSFQPSIVGSPVDSLARQFSEHSLNSSPSSGQYTDYTPSGRAVPSDWQSSVSGSISSGSPHFSENRSTYPLLVLMNYSAESGFSYGAVFPTLPVTPARSSQLAISISTPTRLSLLTEI
jgi:hypothetical protein